MSDTVRDHFHSTAEAFDNVYRAKGASALLNRWLRRAVFERLRVALEECRQLGNPTVIDVGCGSGEVLAELFRAGAERAVGVDFAPAMLTMARSRLSSLGFADRTDLIESDFEKYSPAEPADLVVALGVLDYVMKPEAFLAKVRSLTRRSFVVSFPGGHVVRRTLRAVRFRVAGCPLRFYEPEETVQLLRAAGFETIEVRYADTTGEVIVARPDSGS